MFIKILLTCIWLVYFYYRTKKALHMAQQNLYDDDKRYFKWIKKNFSKIMLSIELIQVLLIFLILFINNNVVSIILFVAVYLILGFRAFAVNDMEVVKKRLIITARVRRILFTVFVIYGLSIFFLSKLNINYYVIITFLVYLQYFIVLLAIKINIPVEKLVFISFKRKAMKKLNSMPNLKVVGITGSYGKTSSKNILNDILNTKYNSIATPKNLNTPYGLIITINNYLNKFDDIFIAEMGAYKRGEILELCNLVNPTYGILTRIGTAHLELFGSQENIQKGKFELIESLPSDGVAVLNADDPLQVNYKIRNKVPILWIGIDNDAHYRATNIKVTKDGTTFDVITHADKKKYSFQTKLLGYNNIYNILAGIALGHHLGISMTQLIGAVKSVNPVEHRLEIKRNGDVYYIDDAYNSNPVGSSMALDVLNMMPGKKIIVTPGMVELGKIEDEENMKFGEHIASVCDEVILVGDNQTKAIQKGLENKKFSKENIHILEDVIDAFPLIEKLKEKETYVLLENDLPDLFK